MSYLLIDIGNTRIKWMLLADVFNEIPQSQAYEAVVHAGDFKAAVEKSFANLPLSNEKCAVVISNVAGMQAKLALDSFFESKPSFELRYIAVERQRFGFENKYQRLPELGVDRWVSIIGARQLVVNKNIIVVNCGTAITVDFLNASNEFVGGAILPGFDLALSALSSADGIARFDASGVDFNVGDTTQGCVRLGVLSSCVGGVEKMISNITSSLSREEQDGVSIVVSGGAAHLLLGSISHKCIHDANLVFRGLREFAAWLG